MIATILPGSTNFHAVGYNERKVAKGVARMLEMQNFGTLGTFDKPTSEELVTYLQEYTSRNTRIEKAQFHVAFSCKGHEMTETELLDFAHRYLSEMGYGEEGQPLLVYSHYDTDNTHLHIVTSRIAPDGKKILHDHERRRSQEVIDRILGNDRKQKAEKDIEAAKQYTFSSFAQFKAIMTSMGYEVYQKDGTVFVKHGGKVQQKILLAEIESLYKKGYYNRACNRQLRSILKKYRDVSSNKEELQKELKTKFGIDIVFFGKKDAAYGYIIVDHANKTVIHGAKVLAVEELLDFANPEQRFDRMEDFIDRLLTLNPKITQGEIFQKLKRYRAYIKKGAIYFNGESRPLKPFMADTIDRNNRIINHLGYVIEYIQSYLRRHIEKLPILANTQIRQPVDGLVYMFFNIVIFDSLNGCINLKRQRNCRIIKFLGTYINRSRTFTDLDPILTKTWISQDIHISWFICLYHICIPFNPN